MVKNPAANAGDVGSVPGLERSPGGGSGNHPTVLAWKIPWTEEPGRVFREVTKSQTQLNDWARTQIMNWHWLLKLRIPNL